MKLPEPVAWMYTKNGFCDVSSRCWEPWEVEEGFREQRLFTEAQMHEALASHEAVMRTALEALEKALAEPAVKLSVGDSTVLSACQKLAQAFKESPPPPAEPVSALESVLCDPSGKCSIKGSDADRAIVDAALSALRNEVAGCFEMALGEGLAEALAETTDERLKDLVERRLMFALYAAQKASPPPPAEPARTSQDVCTVPLLSVQELYEILSSQPWADDQWDYERAIEAAVRRKAGL